MFNQTDPGFQWWVTPSPLDIESAHGRLNTPSLAARDVRLREITARDISALTRLLARESCSDGTMDTPQQLTPAATRDWLKTRLAESGDTTLQWALSPLGSDRLTGYLALHDIDFEHGQAELSFRLDSLTCAASEAREAGNVVLAFAFGVLDLRQVCAFIPSSSAASGARLADLGMRPESLGLASADQWQACPGLQIWSITKSRWMRRLLA